MRAQVSLYVVIALLLVICFVVLISIFYGTSILRSASSDPAQLFVESCVSEVSGCYLFYHGLSRIDKEYIEDSLALCYNDFSSLPWQTEIKSGPNIDIKKEKEQTDFLLKQDILQILPDKEYYLNKFSADHPVQLKYVEEFYVGDEIDISALLEFDGIVELYEYQ